MFHLVEIAVVEGGAGYRIVAGLGTGYRTVEADLGWEFLDTVEAGPESFDLGTVVVVGEGLAGTEGDIGPDIVEEDIVGFDPEDTLGEDTAGVHRIGFGNFEEAGRNCFAETESLWCSALVAQVWSLLG